MARINNLRNFLTDVASAIKTKLGDETLISASKFDEKILAIPTQGEYQSKQMNILQNGNYTVTADEGYDALSEVTLHVEVQASADEQHMPFYTLESDDDGELWCGNNYDELLYVPYALDIDGNLIVIQDDNDIAVYSINENMELEVVIDG